MRLFKPNVDKMFAKRDVDGLVKTLADPEKQFRSTARDALIRLGESALPALCVAVHGKQVNVRVMSSWAIGDIGEKATGNARTQALEALLTALQDEESSVRQNAVVGLGMIRDPQIAEPLVAFFATIINTDDKVWEATRVAIVKIGISAVDPLLGTLKHKNDLARRGSAWALGDIGDTQSVDPLISSMKDKDFIVRQNAASALGKLGDLKAVQSLTIALQDQAMPVRRNAASALGQLGNEKDAGPLATHFNSGDSEEYSSARQVVFGLLELMSDSEKEVCEAAKKALEGFGQEAMIPMTIALAEENEKAARGATSILVEKGVDALPALITTLQQGNTKERQAVARVLGNIKSTQVVDPLIVALKDDDAEVRWVAARALGNIQDAEAVDPLIEAFKDSDTEVRRAAAWALGNIKDARAVGPLIEVLKDSDIEVRQPAASALGKIEDSQAVDPLIEALKDSDARMRRVAARALGNIKDAQVVDPLIVALKDDDTEVRRAAASALGNIKDARAIEVLAERERIHTTCSVCGKTKASIGEDIKKMRSMGVTVISHDLIAFCENCGVAYCSNHYDWNQMAGTHTCRKCGSDLQVHRSGYGSY